MTEKCGFEFNPYEDRLVYVLENCFRELTTKEISEVSGISYNATKKYLNKLFKENVITKKIGTNRIWWKIK